MKLAIRYLVVSSLLLAGCEQIIDFSPPEVSIAKPQNGERIENHFVIETEVKDNMNIDKIEIYLEDTVFATLSSSPYTYNAWVEGESRSFSLFAKAYDRGGNWRKSEKITLNYFSLTEMGSCDLPDIGNEIVIQGNYAYISYGDNLVTNSGLVIVDISSPANPVQVGSYITPSVAQGLDISGEHVFIADGKSEKLIVLNVSNPSSPYEVAFYEPPDDPIAVYDVIIKDNYAYVTDEHNSSTTNNGGFAVVDISDPLSPQEIGYCEYKDPNGQYNAFGPLVVSGNYAYTTSKAGGIVVIDISTPSSPTVVGKISQGGAIWNLAKYGNFLYIPFGDLYVWDISNPLSPVEVGTCDLPNTSAKGVAVSGEYAYIACYPSTEGKELWKVKTSNLAQMFVSGYCNIAGENRWRGVNIALSGKYAYITVDYSPDKLVVVKVVE